MSESIRSVNRALDVLLCFSVDSPELSMTQIAEKININKSTVHRLLLTLEKRHFVERDPVTGLYQLGYNALQMAYLVQEHNSLRKMAEPYLLQLLEDLRENVNLSILDGADVVYLHVIESPQRVKLAASTGQRLPAFCTASGKAILALLPEEMVRRTLARNMTQYTATTIQTEEAFFEEMRIARERGFALAEQEYEEGINAIAAPITGRDGRPIASLAIAGPSFRLTREKMLEMSAQVVAAARRLSQEILISCDPRPA